MDAAKAQLVQALEEWTTLFINALNLTYGKPRLTHEEYALVATTKVFSDALEGTYTDTYVAPKE
jgi:hypothetical protein